MRSHIHELWEELDLEPLYPEPDLDRVMDQVMDRIAAEEPQAEGTAHVIKERRRPMHKRKLLLSLAAALVVLTGSAVAVGSQLGLLNVFFQGDTSGLEPYVQTDLGSAENEDYRFTVDSAYYDGMTVYATVTVEGLNDQAVEDLKSNRADAEAHREMWGDALADNMLETGKFGPDTIRANQDEVTEAAGFWYSGGNGGIHELEAPSDTSRSWQVDFTFSRWLGPLDIPLKVWAGLMGEEYAVEIPLDTVVGAAHLEPDQEFLFNPLTDQRAILTEVTLTPTQLYYEIQTVGEMKTDTGWDVMDGRFVLKMKDGSLITSSQLHGLPSGGKNGWDDGEFAYGVEFHKVLFSDVSEVEAIIFGDTEFPLDGSEPTLADESERFYPFYVPRYDENGPWCTDVEALCRGLGAEYIWDEDTQTATATYRDVTIQMTVGSSQVLVNGKPVELTGSVWDEELQDWIDDVPLPIAREDGMLLAPTYLFYNWSAIGDTWDVSISYLHVDGQVNQDPDRLVVLP